MNFNKILFRIGISLSLLFLVAGSEITVTTPIRHSFSNNEQTGAFSALYELSDNATIWTDLTWNLNDSVVVTNNAKLTIINCHINFTGTESGFVLENDSVLLIRNSTIEYGDVGISGETEGSVDLLNTSFSRFSGDAIHLEGGYNVSIDQSLFYNNEKDAIQLEDTFTFANITNTAFVDHGKDGLNLEEVWLHVDNCSFYNSGDEHIQFDGPTGAFNVKNSVFDTTASGDGIKLRGYNGSGLLENITVERSNDDGIQVTEGSPSVTFRDVRVRHSTEDGIEADSAAEMTIERSRFSQNGIHGIEIREMGPVTITDSLMTENLEFGIRALNLTSLEIMLTNISHNSHGGLEVSSTETVEIDSTRTVNNTGFFEGCNGISAYNCTTIAISNTIVKSNSGYGIKLEESNGTIFYSTIQENNKDGIALFRAARSIIQNNSISSNIGNGIFIGSSSDGIIHYNNITANHEYGVLAQPSVNDRVIDANYNYWGSDDGPEHLLVSEVSQDEISGPVNTSIILTEDGEIRSYRPIKQPDQEPGINYGLIIGLLLVILAIGPIIGISMVFYFPKRWKREAKPHLAILMSEAGLPAAYYTFAGQVEDIKTAMFSGFITALQSFFNAMIGPEIGPEKGKKKASLQEITHDVGTVLMRPLGNWGAVLIVEKSNPLLRRRMNLFARSIAGFIETIDTDTPLIEGLKYQSRFQELVKAHFSDFEQE
ncbi:MAG: right-handed parallel beta-helix repeat-containing protein [Candidatus Hodarchaeales archaeon]